MFLFRFMCFLRPSIYLTIHLSICHSIYMVVYVSVYVSFSICINYTILDYYLSSIDLSIWLCVYLYLYLNTYLKLYRNYIGIYVYRTYDMYPYIPNNIMNAYGFWGYTIRYPVTINQRSRRFPKAKGRWWGTTRGAANGFFLALVDVVPSDLPKKLLAEGTIGDVSTCVSIRPDTHFLFA